MLQHQSPCDKLFESSFLLQVLCSMLLGRVLAACVSFIVICFLHLDGNLPYCTLEAS